MNKVYRLFGIAGLVFINASCKHSDPAGNYGMAPVPVNIAIPEYKHVVYYNDYPANVVALKEVELRCEVGGEITGIFFEEGQTVKQGQKLYEVDRSSYEASYQQAKANLDIAQSNLERVQKDADRYTELSKQDAIAQQRLDDALTNLQNAKLQLVSAKAGLVKAQTELNYSIVSAPFDGTIGISKVRMGTLVTPGQTLLNIISSDDPMGVDFVINETELSRFQMLEKKSATKNDSTFRILLPDNAIYPQAGKISIIDRAVDPQTGTIRVRLSFPNRERILRPGMSCNVKVLNENTGNHLVIPYKAVSEQMGESYVYTVKGNVAKQAKLDLGARVGENVIVNSGLSQTDTVVTDGIQKLREGAILQIGSGSGSSGNARP